jgi:N-acetylglutamate synthase-like GNAT family acetyltransferase
MIFKHVTQQADLEKSVKILNESHATVAMEFGLTKENCPTNNAFIDIATLKNQLNKGIKLYQLMIEKTAIGCIAIEKSLNEKDTYYIEKVSVIPQYRHHGYGVRLMNFATKRIINAGGKIISIALFDANKNLKEWYSKQGFIETATKDYDHLPFRVCFMKKQL